MRRRALALLLATVAMGSVALGTVATGATAAGASVNGRSHHGVVEKKKPKCDVGAIKNAYNTVLNTGMNAPVSQKEAYVQYLDTSPALRAQFEQQQAATTQLATGTLPVINSVKCAKNGKTASVDFDLSFNGTVDKSAVDAPGRAVLDKGTWKMAAKTMCDLQALADPSVSASGPCAVVMHGGTPN